MFKYKTTVSRYLTPLAPFQYYAMSAMSCNEQSYPFCNNIGDEIYGYGNDRIEQPAVDKSVSELYERFVFLCIKNNIWIFEQCRPHDYSIPKISSGFAAHYSLGQAKQNALLELFERHCLYLMMIGEIAMDKLDYRLMPRYCRAVMRIIGLSIDCYSFNTNIPTVFLVCRVPSGGCIFASSSRTTYSEAISAAVPTIAIRLLQYKKYQGGDNHFMGSVSKRFEHWIQAERYRRLYECINGCIQGYRNDMYDISLPVLIKDAIYYHVYLGDRYIVQSCNHKLKCPLDIPNEYPVI